MIKHQNNFAHCPYCQGRLRGVRQRGWATKRYHDSVMQKRKYNAIKKARITEWMTERNIGSILAEK